MIIPSLPAKLAGLVLALVPLAANADLVAYYRLDETSGAAVDSSGNGHTADMSESCSGMVRRQRTVEAGTYGDITLSAGQAAEFDTAVDFGTTKGNFGNYTVNAAGSDAVGGLLERGSGAVKVAGSLTVMAWIYLDEASGEQTIFSSSERRNGWRFVTNGKQLRFTMLGAQAFHQGASLEAGAWYHAAATVKDDTISIYLNGKLLGAQKASARYIEEGAGFEVRLGGMPFSAGNFHGRLDEVKVFDQALTVEEICAAAQPGARGPRPPLEEGVILIPVD